MNTMHQEPAESSGILKVLDFSSYVLQKRTSVSNNKINKKDSS